jgi:hypothetical protein
VNVVCSVRVFTSALFVPIVSVYFVAFCVVVVSMCLPPGCQNVGFE